MNDRIRRVLSTRAILGLSKSDILSIAVEEEEEERENEERRKAAEILAKENKDKMAELELCCETCPYGQDDECESRGAEWRSGSWHPTKECIDCIACMIENCKIEF